MVIQKVLEDGTACTEAGEEYTGERSEGSGGHNRFIPIDSEEAEIVADCMEKNYGLTRTTRVVNNFRKRIGKPTDVRRSSVRNCWVALKPLVTTVQKRKAGNYRPGSAWAHARWGWCLQLAIMLGIVTKVITTVVFPYGTYT